MKLNKRYTTITVIALLLLAWLESMAPEPLDWQLSFSKADKIPYGSFIIYDVLEDLFPAAYINSESLPIVDIFLMEVVEDEKANYLFINSEFPVDQFARNHQKSHLNIEVFPWNI